MHTVCVLDEVSHHRTSEGVVSYHRCRCGRLEVRRGDAAVLSSAGDPRSAPTSGRGPGTPTGGSRIAATAGGIAVAVLAVALVLVASIAVPPAALVVGVGLGLFLGALAGVGAWFVEADPHRGVRVALSTTAIAIPVVLAGTGLVAAFGPASVIALPVLYGVTGLVWWVGRSPRSAV